jgi:hypothetical protein
VTERVHCLSLRTGEEIKTGMSFASIIKNVYLVPVWYYTTDDSLFALECKFRLEGGEFPSPYSPAT